MAYHKKIGRTVREHSPWLGRNEFEEVYLLLYSEDLFDRQRGVSRVSLWESRSHPSLPLGVCVTASIVNAKIKDEFMKADIPTILRPDDLRLMYGAAITRFVNLMCEKASRAPLNFQSPRFSIKKAALQVHIPEWIIDLRHEATHKKMPCLTLLRSGASYAKKWLKANYWIPELDGFKDCIEYEKYDKTYLQKTIAEYLSAQSSLLIDCGLTKTEKIPYERELKIALKKMERQVLENHKTFFEVLVAPGAFLHTGVELGSFLELDSPYVFNDTNSLPDRLTELWMPLIKMFNENNLLQEFIEALFKYQQQLDEQSQHIISKWCYTLIDTSTIYRTDFQEVPENKRPCLNWIRLMAACSWYPTKPSACLFPKIMKNINSIEDNKKNLIMMALAIHSGLTIQEEESPPKKRIKTDICGDNIKRAFSTDHDVWRPSAIQISGDDINWELVPLGTVMNPLDATKEDEKLEEKAAKPAEQVVSISDAEGDVEFCQIQEVHSEATQHVNKDTCNGEVQIYPLNISSDVYGL